MMQVGQDEADGPAQQFLLPVTTDGEGPEWPAVTPPLPAQLSFQTMENKTK